MTDDTDTSGNTESQPNDGQPESTVHWLISNTLALWFDWRLYGMVGIILTFLGGGAVLSGEVAAIHPYIGGFFAGWGMCIALQSFEDRFGAAGDPP